MNTPDTDYKNFEQSSIHNRRLLREEELILEVTEAVSAAMAEEGISKAQLARRLGKTKGFISQLLSGGRNLTLRTLANLTDALGYRVTITVSKDYERKPISSESSKVLPLPNIKLGHCYWTQSPDWEKSTAIVPPQPVDGEYGAAA